MNKQEQVFFKEMAKQMKALIDALVSEAIANALANDERTGGDAISQRQAEKEFGWSWMRQHIAVYGRKIYSQSSGSKNAKRTFSRKQLCEMRRQELDDDVYADFVAKYHRIHEGYDSYPTAPDGLKEILLKEKKEQIEKRLQKVENRLRPRRGEPKPKREYEGEYLRPQNRRKKKAS